MSPCNIFVLHLLLVFKIHSNIFCMFIFTGREHKQTKHFNTQCCKFYWRNKMDLFIFVYSFVGNEDGNIQCNICVFEYDVSVDNQNMSRKIWPKLGMNGALNLMPRGKTILVHWGGMRMLNGQRKKRRPPADCLMTSSAILKRPSRGPQNFLHSLGGTFVQKWEWKKQFPRNRKFEPIHSMKIKTWNLHWYSSI